MLGYRKSHSAPCCPQNRKEVARDLASPMSGFPLHSSPSGTSSRIEAMSCLPCSVAASGLRAYGQPLHGGIKSALLFAITAMYNVKQRVQVMISATLQPCCCMNCWRAPRTQSCTDFGLNCCSKASIALLEGRNFSISTNSRSQIC